MGSQRVRHNWVTSIHIQSPGYVSCSRRSSSIPFIVVAYTVVGQHGVYVIIICIVCFFLNLDEKYSIIWLHRILKKDKTQCEPSNLRSIHTLEQGLWRYHCVSLQNVYFSREKHTIFDEYFYQLQKVSLSLQDFSESYNYLCTPEDEP